MAHRGVVRPVLAGSLIVVFAWGAALSGSSVKDRLRTDVAALAGDKMAGRETGEPGIRKAEAYIADRFRQIGLAPLPGEQDYFLEFELFRRIHDRETTSLELIDGDARYGAAAGADFRPFGFSDEGQVEAGVVFAGYGITAEEYEYDDYAGLDVEGKIVFILRHEPGENDADSLFDGTENTRHSQFSVKAENARSRGARGMLLVTDPLNHPSADDLRIGRQLSIDPPEPDEPPASDADRQPFLAAQISRGFAERLASARGLSLQQLQQAVDSGTRPAELGAGVGVARLQVHDSTAAEAVPARNIAGFIEGRDPLLKHEWIVIGGHHDHVGAYAGEGDTVFNGADDNASGVSGVLELARMFRSRKPVPRRSLVFVTFSGEEKGLLGSKALVRNEMIPMDQVVFMFNFDMIGRNPEDEIQVYGDGYFPGLRDMIETLNQGKLPLDYAGAGYTSNSDHDSFYELDIPFLFLFTGLHDDYHQLGDHAEKLSYERMSRILHLSHRILDRLVSDDRSPSFVHNVSWLGARIERVSEGLESQIVITGIDAASRGEMSGLCPGDRIETLDGNPLPASHLGTRFREIEPGDTVAIVVSRAGERHELKLARARTGYMGVVAGRVGEDQRNSFGIPDDEGALLRRVVEDGPSARAGLRDGDILLRFNGQPVSDTSLDSRLSQIGAGETVSVLLLRDAKRIELAVTLDERPQHGG